jgi:two-component system phosphate regulon sensor histidine kinase PhoR
MSKTLVYQSAPLEDKLRFSELCYRRLFETASDGILILDAATGRITDANPCLQELLGYSQSELLDKELWEIGVFKDITDSKIVFFELQNKDGRNVEVELISNVYMVDQQKMIQCNIRDITDRRRTEKLAKSRAEKFELLSKSQEEAKKAMLNVMEDLEEAKALIEIEKAKDEAILSSLGEGLIAVDNEDKITMVNKTAENMLGWKIKDLIGKAITTLPLEDEEGNPIPDNKLPTYLVLSTGKTTNVIYFFVKKDGTRFPLAINVTPIILEGKTIGLIEILRDITLEKEIDRAKNEFVSLASHQLRTPLGISKWYMEVLIGEKYLSNAPKIAREYMLRVYKSNERLLSLVRYLLSISRIDGGKVKETVESVDIRNLVIDTIKSMNMLAERNNITLQIDVKKSNIPNLHIDLLLIQEVIENLIANAIAYSISSGKVDIIVDASENTVSIAVRDTGIGISKEDQKKLFTKFFRSEKAKTKNIEGSGLGLYVVKSYVERWGGKINVESEEGKGSTFTISLPIKSNFVERR